MDPLSITASAVGLAVNILRSAASVKDAVDQFRDAPAVARDIEDEIKIVQASLRQVEAALQRDPQAVWRLHLGDVFDLSVEGCRDTLQQINEEFKTLFGRHDWKLRIAVWWNAGEIGRMLGRLATKKGSLMLLVQALSLHSVQEMQELLQHNMRTLDIARLGLDDMVPSYPACTTKELDTVASAIGSEDSVFGDRDSVISSTRFVFDDICFDSKPYRHTVARVSTKKPKQMRRKAVAASPSLPLLPVEETEADADSELPGEVPAPTSPMGVTPEEHEAVVMKLREAEALIRALRERMPQPDGPKDQPADGPRPAAGENANDIFVFKGKAVEDGTRLKRASQRIGSAPKDTTMKGPDSNAEARRRSRSPDSLEKRRLMEYFSTGENVKNAETRRPESLKRTSQRIESAPKDMAMTGPNTDAKAHGRSSSPDILQKSLSVEYLSGGEKVKDVEARKPVRVLEALPGKHKAQHAIVADSSKTRHRRRFRKANPPRSTRAPDKQATLTPTATHTATGNAMSSTPPRSPLDVSDTREPPLPNGKPALPPGWWWNPRLQAPAWAPPPVARIGSPVKAAERHGRRKHKTSRRPPPAHEASEGPKEAAHVTTNKVTTAEARPISTVNRPRNGIAAHHQNKVLDDRHAESVQDAIKRLIVPELKAMKLENKQPGADTGDADDWNSDDEMRKTLRSLRINGELPLAGTKKSTDDAVHHAHNGTPKRGGRPPSPLLPEPETREEALKKQSLFRRDWVVRDPWSSPVDLEASQERLAQLLAELDGVKGQGQRGGEDGVTCV